MVIISDKDRYISTTWGAAVRLKAGEPKTVGKNIGLLCLQEGCKEYIESKVEEKPVVKKKKSPAKKRK